MRKSRVSKYIIGFFLLLNAGICAAKQEGNFSQVYLLSGVEQYNGDILNKNNSGYIALGLRTTSNNSDQMLGFLTHVFLERSSAESVTSNLYSQNNYQSIGDIGFDTGICIRQFIGICPIIGLSSKSVDDNRSEIYFETIRVGLEIEVPVRKVNVIFTGIHTEFGNKINGIRLKSNSNIFSTGISFDFN